MRTAFLLLATAVIIGMAVGCDAPADCQGSNVSYIKCIRPTLTANCAGAGCHGGDKPEWGLQLEKHGEIYPSILPHINTNEPTKSKLLVQMSPDPPSGRRMPVDFRPFLSASQLKMFEVWISEGAKNDDPDYKGGDVKPEKPEIPAGVANISFKDTIAPLLLKSCGYAGCHATATKASAADLDLENAYDNMVNKKSLSQVYDIVAPSKPLESLLLIKLLEKRPANAGSRMPPGTPLTTEEIAQIYVWIEEGAKNN